MTSREADIVERRLNEFTGASNRTLEIRLQKLDADLTAINADDDGMSGDPREGIIMRIEAIESELERRRRVAALHLSEEGMK
jgi:hypothetical protein